MFDYDPRECESRDRDDGIRDRDEDWLQLGRGPGSADSRDCHKDQHRRERDAFSREERDRGSRERDNDLASFDPRDVFSRHLELPHGPDRERVRDRDREYSLNGNDTRAFHRGGVSRGG